MCLLLGAEWKCSSEGLPSLHEAPVSILRQALNPSIRELEAEDEVQGHPPLHSEFEAS